MVNTFIKYYEDGKLLIGDFSGAFTFAGNVTITGDLDVQGTTTLVATTTTGLVDVDVAGLALDAQNTTDAASNQVVVFRSGDRSTAVDDDSGYLTLTSDNDGGTQVEVGRFEWKITDVTAGSEKGEFSLSLLNGSSSLVELMTVGYSNAGTAQAVLNTLLHWETGQAIDGTLYQIGRNADGTNQFQFNVPTGSGFEWSINDAAIFQMNINGVTCSKLMEGNNASGSPRVRFPNDVRSDIALTNRGDTTAGFGFTNTGQDPALYANSAVVFSASDFNVDVSPATLTSGGTDDYGLQIAQTLNDTGAAGGSDVYAGLKVDVTETDITGWDTVYLANFLKDSTSVLSLTSAGTLRLTGVINVLGTSQILANTLTGTGSNQTLKLQTQGHSSADNAVEMASGTFTNTSGTSAAVAILPTYNQASGTGANTDLLINRTETAVGSGDQFLLELQTGGTQVFAIEPNGQALLTNNTISTANEAAFESSLALGGDVDGVSAMKLNVTGFNAGGTSGNSTYALEIDLSGDGDDTEHEYRGIQINAFSAAGGSGTGTGILIQSGYTAALDIASGTVDFYEYSPTIQTVQESAGAGPDLVLQAANAVTSGNGGSVKIRAGDQAGGNTEGSIELDAPGIIQLGDIANNTKGQNRAFVDAEVQTTDATVTTLLSQAIPSNVTYQVVANVVGNRSTSAEGASYLLMATVRNDAGTLAQVGATTVIASHEDVAGWDATIDVSGTNARVRVTGAASSTIEWYANVQLIGVSE